MKINFMDVSDNNGTVNFEEVITDIQLIKGVVCKASEGITYQDKNFFNNMANALKAGLKTAAYGFYIPDDDPIAQAKNFVAQVKLLGYPVTVVLDIEQHPGWDSLSAETISQNIQAWLDYVQQATGQKPKIYTNQPFIDQYLTVFPLGNYDLWVADFSNTPRPGLNWVAWQHTGNGIVKGVSDVVDLSVLNGDDLSTFFI